MRPTRRSSPGAGPDAGSGGALASASASTSNSASDAEPAPALAPTPAPASSPAPKKLSSRSMRLLRELHIDAKPSLGGALRNRKDTVKTGGNATSQAAKAPSRPDKTSHHAKASSLSSELSSVPSDLLSSPSSLGHLSAVPMANRVVGAQSPTKPTKAHHLSVPSATSSPARLLPTSSSLPSGETSVKPDIVPAKKRTITDYFMSVSSKAVISSPAKRSKVDNQAAALSPPHSEPQKTAASPLRPAKEDGAPLLSVKRDPSTSSLSKPDTLSTPIKTGATSTLARLRTPSLPGKIRTLSLTDKTTPLSQTSASSSRKSNLSDAGSSTKPKRQKGIVSRDTQIKNWKRYGYTSSKHARRVLLNTNGLNGDQDLSASTTDQPDGSVVDQKDDYDEEEEPELGQPDHDISSIREASQSDSSLHEDDGTHFMPQVGDKASFQEDEDVIMPDYDETPVKQESLGKSARRKKGHVRGETLIKNWTRYGLSSYEQAKSLAKTIPTGTEISIDELNKRRDSIAGSRATSDVDGQNSHVKVHGDDNNEDEQDLDQTHNDGDHDEDHEDGDDNADEYVNDKRDGGGTASQRRIFDRNEVIKAIKNPSKGIGSTGLAAKTLISNWRRYGFTSAMECKEWLVSDEVKEGPTEPKDAVVPARQPTKVMSAAEKKARELRRLQIDAKPNLLGSLATPDAISSRRELKRKPIDDLGTSRRSIAAALQSLSKKTSDPSSTLVEHADAAERKKKAEAAKSSSSKSSSKPADNEIMGPPPQPKMINVAINTPGARSSNPEDPEAPWFIVNPKWVNPWFDWLADLVDEDDDDDNDDDKDVSDVEGELDGADDELDNPDEEMDDPYGENDGPDEDIESAGEFDSDVSDSETVVPHGDSRQDSGASHSSSKKEGTAKKLQDLEVMEAWPLVASKARDKGKGKKRLSSV